MKKCKYRLPCGWCDRLNDKCIFEQVCKDIKTSKNPDNDCIQELLDTKTEMALCIHEWEFANSINTAGYVYKCKKCGAIKTEPITKSLQDYITITTGYNEEPSQNSINKYLSEILDACKNCPNHPSNGGSGVCHCILGLPVVTC